MAAILKLRRGTSFTSLQESELFYDTSLGTILLGDGGGSNTTYKTLTKLNESKLLTILKTQELVKEIYDDASNS